MSRRKYPKPSPRPTALPLQSCGEPTAQIHSRGRRRQWPQCARNAGSSRPGRYRLQVVTALRKAAKRTRATPWPSSCASIGNREAFPFQPDHGTGLPERTPKARKAFENFAPGQRRQFIQWYDAAKSPDVRRRRLDRALDILLERALLSRKRR